MKIFVSYASEDRTKAEEIVLALQGQNHKVFFDRTNLIGSDNYHSVIRENIEDADLFLFLISPHSVEPGGYALSELRIARDKWTYPGKGVLPVLLEETDFSLVPAYLKSVTIFQPEGNPAAEIAAFVDNRNDGAKRKFLIGGIALIVLVGLFFAVKSILFSDEPDNGKYSYTVDQFISEYVWRPEMIERVEYTLDPTADFPDSAEDFGLLERVAAGMMVDTIRSINVTFTIRNTTEETVHLEVKPGFFSLRDDQGHQAELLAFCCNSKGDLFGVNEERRIQLVYRFYDGWYGKNISARNIYFDVKGFTPIIRGVWSIPTLATAD